MSFMRNWLSTTSRNSLWALDPSLSQCLSPSSSKSPILNFFSVSKRMFCSYSHNAETARTFLDIQFQKEHQQVSMETYVLQRLRAKAWRKLTTPSDNQCPTRLPSPTSLNAIHLLVHRQDPSTNSTNWLDTITIDPIWLLYITFKNQGIKTVNTFSFICHNNECYNFCWLNRFLNKTKSNALQFLKSTN